jgi:peptidoglycan/LPS O-acetylase OafA/YrhL
MAYTLGQAAKATVMSKTAIAQALTGAKPSMRSTFKSAAAGGITTGFDYLRIVLAVYLLVWHSIWISTGSTQLDVALWSGPFRFLGAVPVPMFFALSGFLVSGSLGRTRLHQFITLRFIRLIPALAVEITLSSVILGLLVTDLPKWEYVTSRHFASYLLNIAGDIHYTLPGVFVTNIAPNIINGQLWTIPFEMESYLALILLSVLTIVARRCLFMAVVCGLSLGLTAYSFVVAPLDPTTRPPGGVLVLCFLAGVSVYTYRDIIPLSTLWGLISVITSLVCLEIPNTSYLAAFPIAYCTVWLGFMRPRAIPFGDLSYGVYLFHFSIEQTVMHFLPGIRVWWMLVCIALPLTICCAWLSWSLIEHPILSRKKLILAKVDHAWEILHDTDNRKRAL